MIHFIREDMGHLLSYLKKIPKSTNVVDPTNTVTLSATVSNSGDRSSTNTTLRWYLSTDSTIDTNDTQVSNTALSSLAPSGASTVSISIIVPNTPGTHYYYGVCVDTVEGESDLNNNCSSGIGVTVTAPGPELEVSDMIAGSAILAPSTTITLTAMLRNVGDRSSTNTTLRWYLSTDSALDTNTDTEVATNAVSDLAPGESLTLSNTITLPSTAGTNTYYACVDAVTNEYNPSNNCSSGIRVVVIPTELIVINMRVDSADVGSSNTITLSAMVSNAGGASASTTLRWYLSTDSAIDPSEYTEIASNALRSLEFGERSNVSISIAVPKPSGTYYYGLCVDPVINEYDPSNNCSSAARVVVTSPELIVSMNSSNTNVAPSEMLTLTAMVSNIGDRSSTNTTLR